MPKVQLDELLQKEMDRKTFLKHAGIAFVAFIGVSSLVKRFNSVTNQSFGAATQPKTSNAYGVATYGPPKY